ncbi:MAG: CDP-6-deoxy-delta-3,4-glucoseen reductase [Proteobacteria bacterium]|nr:CDP-6-deoxy-delta-3,4-glucoseen reductase [Pseudomonadota bacterium]
MNYTVRLIPSQREFTVAPGESVLDAALRQGVALPYGCRSGSCGSCACRLMSGRVDYPEGPPLGLTDEEIAQGFVLACRAHPEEAVVIEAQELAGLSDVVIKTLPARVVKMQRMNHDTMRVLLKLPVVERLQFLAGQYVDILLRDGARRSFSLANAPHDDELLELHIRHIPGGEFTTKVFAEMTEKALVRLQGPLGSFYLRENSSRPILLVGGGTGFAPLKAILEHAFHAGLQRPIHLYWGARQLRDLYLPELPQRWADEHANVSYTPVLSEPDKHWQGRKGWVHEAVTEDYPDLSRYDVYMAGPPPMITAAKGEFLAAGLPYEQLFFDSFDFSPDVQAKLDALADASRAAEQNR